MQPGMEGMAKTELDGSEEGGYCGAVAHDRGGPGRGLPRGSIRDEIVRTS